MDQGCAGTPDRDHSLSDNPSQELIVCRVFQGVRCLVDTGGCVVDKGIQASKVACGLVDNACAIVRFAEVGNHRVTLRTDRHDLGFSGLQLFLVAPADSHESPLSCETESDVSTDSSGAARDQHSVTTQFQIHRLPYPPIAKSDRAPLCPSGEPSAWDVTTQNLRELKLVVEDIRRHRQTRDVFRKDRTIGDEIELLHHQLKLASMLP